MHSFATLVRALQQNAAARHDGRDAECGRIEGKGSGGYKGCRVKGKDRYRVTLWLSCSECGWSLENDSKRTTNNN